MNEKDFGQIASDYLNTGAKDLDHRITNRLAAARQHALAALPASVQAAALVTAGGSGMQIGLGWKHAALIAGPVLALLIALAGINMSRDPNADIGELDAALLTGELPIDAFLDKDFDAWVRGDEGDE